MTINYLLSKVRKPRIQPELVRRSHLTELIENGSWRKLTLVCAPPGFGKTTLLIEWSQETHFPVCWFQEDEQDNLIDNFLAYLCLSIQQVWPEFGSELLQMVKLTPRPEIDFFANTFIRELENLPQKICLILDDHHLITNSEIHHFLRIVLDYLPQNIHLIISGREDPPLPLGRYRAKNELSEIRTSDLRFNKIETKELIDSITHTVLSPSALEALHGRTEGWAAGIQLAGLSILESTDIDKFIQDFTGSNRFILDYLLEDVLNRQPVEIREFLLKTSILDKFNISLCSAVTGIADAEQLFARIKAANLFLTPLDENSDWYRYHHLFSDLLQFRLKQEVNSSEVKALHASAAKWMETNSMLAEAVQHYYLAEDIEDCNNTAILLASTLLEEGEAARNLDWMDSLPRDVFEPSLGLLTIYSFSLVTASKLGYLEKYYLKIEKLLANIREYIPDEQYSELNARLDVLKAMHFSTKGDTEQAIRLFDNAVDHISQGEALLIGALIGKGVAYQIRGEILTAEQIFASAASKAGEISQTMLEISSLSNQAGMLVIMGKLHQAEEILLSALNISLATQGKRNPIVASVYLGLAGIYFMWNRMGDAQINLTESYDWLVKWGNVDVLMNFLFQATRLSFFNEPEKVQEYIKKAHELAAMGQMNPATALIAKNISLFGAIKENDIHTVRHLVNDIWGMRENYLDSSFTSLMMTCIEAGLNFSILSPDELLPRVRQILEYTEKTTRKMENIHALILLSVIYNKTGKPDQAVETLAEAIESAYKEHGIADFLDYGNQIKDILITLRSRIADDLAGRLYRRYSGSNFSIRFTGTGCRFEQGNRDPARKQTIGSGN